VSHDPHLEVARFYDDVYYRNARDQTQHSRHLTRLAHRLGVTHGQVVLDVACGTGDWLAVAASQGAAVSGIDISKRAIDICKQRLPKSDLRIGPAETLPLANAQFDLVTCLGALEHFLDQPGALKEMVRVSKPDAKVLLLVPNAGFLTYRLGLYGGTHQQSVHETIRTLDEWRDMFNKAGLEVTARWKDLYMY
jgi:ubiquinone/menaquinone biosynthesis C-methylase UbiE